MTAIVGRDGDQETTEPRRADLLVRGLPVLLVIAALAWVAKAAAAPIHDPDAWWHLRLGNDLIAQGSLSAPAHWSSFATVPWVPTEPLPEIVSAYVERWWGLPGLAVLFCVAGLVVVLTIYLTDRRVASPLPTAVATLLTVLAASGSLTSRPQLVSFVLLPVVLAAWLRSDADLRPRWWLVPLIWFWSMCHGFWLFGVGYGVVTLAGIALDRRADLRTWGRLLAVAVASLAVVALNPVGPGVLEAPFAVRSTARFVSEWQRTRFTYGWSVTAAAMVVATVVLWLVVRRHVGWTRILMVASAAFLVWDAARLVVVGALVVSPLLAEALEWALARSRGNAGLRAVRRREVGSLAAVAFACLAVVVALVPHTSSRPGDVPTGLDPSLDRLPPGTRVFNDYVLGGWLVWRHPDLDQYVDGLITPYSDRHVAGYVTAVTTGPGWYRIVDRSRAPVALLRAGSLLARGLDGKGWRTVASSDGWVLLHRPTGTSG